MQPFRVTLKRCAPITTRRPSHIRSIRHLARMGDKHASGSADDYNKWTKDGLIERVRRLEAELKSRPSPPGQVQQATGPASGPAPKKRKEQTKIDPANYNTRYVILRLAYLGRNYGGFEFASSGTLPSVEEELFKALTRACLIFPKDDRVVDFSTCDYSKCGRTDRGVSAFGQVIGLRLRSARPVPGRMKRKKKEKRDAAVAAGKEPDTAEGKEAAVEAQQETEPQEPPPFDPIRDELPYANMLNRLLPRDIRVLAWCPNPPPDFSARFSCREREYRYFFTQPAFNPPSSAAGADGQPHTGWLDIEAMRDAARRFEGDQDFQNFCKIDPAKNVGTYRRTILESTIHEADDMGSALPHLASSAAEVGAPADVPHPKVYYFRVRGTAFLWHQIRHMVSVLFHVGQGLESPDVVDRLLDTESNPGRPTYTMADEVPLVLWNCSFRDEQGQDLDWIHVDKGSNPGRSTGAATTGTADSLWRLWRESKMDEILANGLLRVATSADELSSARALADDGASVKSTARKGEYSTRRFEGGNGPRLVGKYTPIMDMPLMDTPKVQNDRYAQRKGFADHEEMLKHRVARFEEKMNQADD